MKLRRPLRLGLLRLSLLAIVVGIITGFGAVLFRALIGLIHNAAFLGVLAVDYEASVFTPPSPWGAFIILVPVIGGLIVTFLITNFAPEARGHGVPEVMDAIYYKEGVIRPVVAVIKSLASALSIGTGAAVGREGAHHPDRFSDRLDARPNRTHGALAADHVGRGRRRRRHRRDLQHADRRRHVRDRNDDGGTKRAHVSAGRARDRDRDVHRAHLFRHLSGVRHPQGTTRLTSTRFPAVAASLCITRRPHRTRGRGFHPYAELCRNHLRAHRQSLPAQRHRHACDRRADLRPAADRRPLLCRGRRLFDDPSDSDRRPRAARTPLCFVRSQDRRHFGQPWVRRIGRNILTFPIHGRDAWRRVWPPCQFVRAGRGHRRHHLRHY